MRFSLAKEKLCWENVCECLGFWMILGCQLLGFILMDTRALCTTAGSAHHLL